MQLVQDARRFIMYHKRGIESSPLQAYGSALLFSPTSSLTRRLFKHEEPEYITVRPAMGDSWSACLQTLEGHSGGVRSVAFSHDSARLASASDDSTVKIWDASSGECLSTLRIGLALVNISFDTTDTCLHTEIGTIMIGTNSVSTTTPRYQRAALSPERAWLTYDSKYLVWLPSEYRPSCSVVSGSKIGIGVGSGKVWMCDFKLGDSPRT